MIVIERNKFFIIYIYIMNKNDISMNISINIIYSELLKMYNNSKTIETFSLPSIDNNMKTAFIYEAIKAKNNGYEINFTIDELHNVLSNLELRAKLLTREQQKKRKKVFINIKDILIKFKESGNLDTFINNFFNSDLGILLDPKFNNAINSNFNPLISIKPNILAFNTLIINILDLFIKDIDNLNKIDIKIIIIIILIILLVMFGILYINK